MPRPYSIDLRKKIIQAIENGHSLDFISKCFKIALKTIYIWRKQLENTGDLAPNIDYQKGFNRKLDLKSLKEFIDNNNTLTIKQIAGNFEHVTTRTIYRSIKSLGYCYENGHWVCVRNNTSEMKTACPDLNFSQKK